MKYIITGSLGHISLPVVEKLVAAGHEVTVISSSPERTEQIEKLGATAAIGSLTDGAFLSDVFKDADAAYLMVPPNYVVEDFFKYQAEISDNYLAAIQGSSIKYVVQLSSIGAHLRKDTGPIDGIGYLEEKLLELENVNVKVLRPSYFFANLFSLVGMIKYAGIAGNNFGNTDEKLVLVDTSDIAVVAGEFLVNLDFIGYTITYISSDERHPNEIAEILGKAVGKEGTPWITFSDEEAFKGMTDAGLSEPTATGYTAMGKSLREGKLQEEYWKEKPAVSGKYKLEDFAKDFAVAYQNS